MAAFEARCARERDSERYLVEAFSIEERVAERLTPDQAEAGAGGEVHPSHCPKGRVDRYWRDEYARALAEAKVWLAKENEP